MPSQKQTNEYLPSLELRDERFHRLDKSVFKRWGDEASTFHPSLKYSGNDTAATDQLIFLGFPRDPVFKRNILGTTCTGACSSHLVISFEVHPTILFFPDSQIDHFMAQQG